jgi:tellurite resistance protein TerB
MGLLGKIFGGATATVSRVSGRTDLLEGVCASAALIAAADGNIGPEEVTTAIDVVKNNETLGSAFDARTIETTMDKMLNRAKGGYSGQAQLYKEISEIGKNPEDGETVYLIALDVAFADGNCDAKERAVITNLAKYLGVDANKYPLPPLAA